MLEKTVSVYNQLPTHLCICSFIHTPIHLFIYPSVHSSTIHLPSFIPSIHLPIHPHLPSQSLYPPTHPPICSLTYISIYCLFLHPCVSTQHPSAQPSMYSFTHSSIHPPTHLSIYPPIHSLIHLFINSFIYVFTHIRMSPLTHLSVHSLIHPLKHTSIQP